MNSTRCCGAMELDNLSTEPTPESAFEHIIPAFDRHSPVFITFTGVTKRYRADHVSARLDDIGQAFADFIEKHRFGTVVRSEERVSNISRNTLRMWIWHPDYNVINPYIISLRAGTGGGGFRL